MDNFDLKKFLVENKLTENSRLGEIKAVPGSTGIKDKGKLKVGDIITPDMWDKQKFINEPDLNGIKVYNEVIKDSWIIDFINYEDIDYEGIDSVWFVGLKSSTADHKYFGLWSEPEELDNINNVLKDKYKILSPDDEKIFGFQ
jgi:hypothetical protein